MLFNTGEDLNNHNTVEHGNTSGDQETSKSVKNMIDDMIEKVIDLSDTESLASDNSEEDKDEDINIDYEHFIETEAETEAFKGKKPMFVQTVKAFKQIL